MAKIILSGYFGFDNLGDEGILLSMISAFKSIDPNLEILVLSGNPVQTREIYQVSSINRNNIPAIIKELRDCDLFISGGGSLLQDITGWKSIPFYLGQVIIAQLMGKKTAFYGQGIGPVKSKFYQWLIKVVMNRANYISVRDSVSRELLLKWGVKEDKLDLSIDPVFVLNGLLKESQEEVDGGEKPLIGVSVRPWRDNSYLSNFSIALSKFVQEQKGDIIILPLHGEEDQEISKKLQEILLKEFQQNGYLGEVFLERYSSPLDILKKYQEIDLFLGVRLHSLVFAAISNVPFVGLEYDPKIAGFLRMLGINSGVKLQDLESEELYRIISSVQAHSAQFKAIMKQKTSLFAKYALESAVDLLRGENND